jgi:hypothetical protein
MYILQTCIQLLGKLIIIIYRNIEALSGTLSLSQCEEAAACEHVYLENADEWTNWPTVPTEGDMAALLRRVTKHSAEFRIVLPDLKLARDIANWTSRKIRMYYFFGET